MTLLDHALRAAHGKPASARAPTLLVAGGGGALGSAVLESALGGRRFSHVKVMARRGFTVAMNGLEAVIVEDLAAAPTEDVPMADVALVVFDRERHANGRELAFARPMPEELPVLAGWLRRHGVQHLIVVMPHAVSTLPNALKAGLANLDEQAVAQLGFEHLVFVRSAQAPTSARAQQWLQRLADGVIAQMRIMVPAANQPVRALKVAQFVAELASRLPTAEPGTRVAPPELVWQAAQLRDPAALVDAWLSLRELPPVKAPRMRL